MGNFGDKNLHEQAQEFLKRVGHRERRSLDTVLSEVFPAGEPPWSRARNRGNSARSSTVLSPDRRLYLSDVAARPGRSTTERNRDLGYSGSTGNDLKRKLIGQGLVTELPLSKAGGPGAQKKLLNPEEAGLQLLGLSLSQFEGQGSFLHRWFARQIKQQLAEMGFQAYLEYGLKGKRADLGYRDQRGLVAVEVELSVQGALQNVQQDLRAGFTRVEVYANTKATLAQIEKHCAQAGLSGASALFRLLDTVLTEDRN